MGKIFDLFALNLREPTPKLARFIAIGMILDFIILVGIFLFSISILIMSLSLSEQIRLLTFYLAIVIGLTYTNLAGLIALSRENERLLELINNHDKIKASIKIEK